MSLTGQTLNLTGIKRIVARILSVLVSYKEIKHLLTDGTVNFSVLDIATFKDSQNIVINIELNMTRHYLIM